MKLTQKHYELFKSYCLEYQKKFDLMGWNIAFQFKKLTESYAKASMDLEASNVTICLTTEWDETVIKVSDYELKQIAKHEVLHVLLGRLECLAQYRYVMSRELDAAGHDIIQKLLVLIKD